MKIAKFFLATLLLLTCHSQETSETYDAAVLGEILAGMRRREASIKDVRCEFSEWSVNPSENTVRRETLWAYKEGKEYRDESNFNERDGKLAWRAIKSFDGQRMYHYEPNRKVGLIGRYDKDIFSGAFTPRTLLCWDLDRSVIGFQDVAGYIAASKIVALEEKTVGSDRIYVISGEHKRDPAYEIWINTDKDYRIERFIQYHGPDRKRCDLKVEVTKFDNYAGTWFPVEGSEQGLFQLGQPMVSLRLRVKAGSLKLNEGIPDDFFTLKFPEGTCVYDEFAERKKRARFIGKQAPPLHIAHWFGSERLTLEQLRGKVVLLEFWSISCGPCHNDFDFLNWLNRELRSKGLVVIAVHAPGASKESVEEFLKEKKIGYIVALDEEMEKGPGKTFDAYNAEGWPETHLIDRKGIRKEIGSLGELWPLLKSMLDLRP